MKILFLAFWDAFLLDLSVSWCCGFGFGSYYVLLRRMNISSPLVFGVSSGFGVFSFLFAFRSVVGIAACYWSMLAYLAFDRHVLCSACLLFFLAA